MAEDHASAMWEFTQALAGDLLTRPDLSEPEWDTFAVLGDVADDRVAVSAYTYTESGPPVPIRPPQDFDLFSALRDGTRGPDGTAWDVVVVKFHRDTAGLVMDFHSGAAAEPFRIRPENMDTLPEAIRPRTEDFAEG